MSRLLQGVRFRPHRVTLGGALGGLLEYSGRDLPEPYLMGVSGLAFRLTLDVVFSPSGPVEISFHDLFPLWENLGAWFKHSTDREESLQRIRTSIDRGWPVIAYDLLSIPEYGLVVGYESGRLACLTLNNPEVPEWMEADAWPPAARAQFSRPEAVTLLDLAPGFDPRRAEVASLRSAVERFWAPPSRDMWLQHGLKAYEFWIAVLNASMPLHGPEAGLGHSYNLMHLQRARRDAAVYLGELATRYPELQGSAASYSQVAAALEEGTALLPFPGEGLVTDKGKRKAVADCLRRALAAERQGVDGIERGLRSLR